MASERPQSTKSIRAYKPRSAAGRSGSKGAVKKGSNKKLGVREKTRWLLGVKILTLLAVFYVTVEYVPWGHVNNKVQALVNKPVANVVVKGDFTYLARSTVQQMVMEHIEGNFVEIDLTRLRENLQQNPWVKNASVQRLWPDGLAIEVREQKPIARWGNHDFINNEGMVINIESNERLSHLPRLAGPSDQSMQITRTYLQMTEMLASRDLVLVGVNVDSTLAWSVNLEGDVEIVFGQYDVLTKLRNFLLVYDTKLKTQINQISRVDMRYESGMAVAWRSQGENALQAMR